MYNAIEYAKVDLEALKAKPTKKLADILIDLTILQNEYEFLIKQGKLLGKSGIINIDNDDEEDGEEGGESYNSGGEERESSGTTILRSVLSIDSIAHNADFVSFEE